MNDSCRKISRGQVWFLVDNDIPLVHTAGSIQGKNRPWLVVSNNQCNQSSPIYTVVPLTTAPKNNQPTHVTFSTGDKPQTILCEQIRTVSQQAFFNAGSSYKWTMSEKYMALVDEALAIQLGLSLIFPKSEQFWESLERLIRTRVKQAIADSKVEALDISKIATLLDARVEEAIKQETNTEHETEPETVAEPEAVAEIEGLPSSIEEPKRDWVPIKKSKPRNKWTDEGKLEFLEYYDTHGARKTADKYSMQIRSVHTTRFKFYKELRANGKLKARLDNHQE